MMRNIHRNWMILGLALLAFSCHTQEPLEFDQAKRYIYIDPPYKYNPYGQQLEERVDSLLHSFAFDDADVTGYTFEIPVSVAGFPADADCRYSIEIVEDETTALDADWDVEAIKNPIFRKGVMSDTLYVRVKKEKNADFKYITLRILPNEHFDLLPDKKLTQIRLAFADQLPQPTWWNAWRHYFGATYYREVYKKWIEIYYLGADSKVDYSNKQPLYWGNMPTMPVESWYPVLFMYLRVLKQYFIDNEVYPDGDSTRDRILLP